MSLKAFLGLDSGNGEDRHGQLIKKIQEKVLQQSPTANLPHQQNPPGSGGPGDQGGAHKNRVCQPTQYMGSRQVRTTRISPKIWDTDARVSQFSQFSHFSQFRQFWQFYLGRVQKLKSAKVWSLSIEGGGSPRTKSLFRISIFFKLLVCTVIHPIYGEIIDWGS